MALHEYSKLPVEESRSLTLEECTLEQMSRELLRRGRAHVIAAETVEQRAEGQYHVQLGIGCHDTRLVFLLKVLNDHVLSMAPDILGGNDREQGEPDGSD